MFRSPLLHLCAVVSLLAACSSPTGYINAYKIDIQQGNVLTQEMVAQLKPGQTREQVRYILGTPLLNVKWGTPQKTYHPSAFRAACFVTAS